MQRIRKTDFLFITWWAVVSLVGTTSSHAQSVDGKLPRFPAVEVEEALETFETAPGFRLELVASEPLVHDPVAMAFDEFGRLFVVEMRGYSEQREDRLGAIRVLEDTDGDGKYETSSVLIDELAWPTAVTCWKGGVFVAAPPDIWYFKDNDGDGKAEVRNRVLTGFSHENVQAMVNSFRWGLDNRIHGATSSGGAELAGVEGAVEPVKLRLRDFAFDPVTMAYGPTTEGGQHGMGFDDWGHKFSCSNSDHIKQVVYEERYLSRNRFFSAPDSRLSIAAEGRQPEVFRISPVEPWRELRTRLRLEGKLMQFRLEGGGRAAGYFTAATGITIYRGDAWPAKYRGIAMVGDVGSNLIHRNRLKSEGIPLSAHRMDEKSEFIASSDTWFRPVQFANGPDGNLYVADMYREIIEHPWSFGDAIKPMLDLTSGNDRGRIYRIVHEDGGEREPRMPGELQGADLVAMLEHENAWHRETAARLLYERQDKSAVSAIRSLGEASRNPLGRMHALYALQGLGALERTDLISAVADADPGVREHAIRLAEPLVEDESVKKAMLALTDDPSLRVRFQLAFSLGQLTGDEVRTRALTELARRDANDPWIRMAVFTSLDVGAEKMFTELLADESFRGESGAPTLFRELAQLIARKNDPREFEQLLSALGELPSSEERRLALPIVLGLREGMRTGSAISKRLMSKDDVSPGAVRFRKILQNALAVATDSDEPEQVRLDAIRLAGLLPLEQTREPFASLLGGAEPDPVQRQVVSVLGRYTDSKITDLVVSLFPSLTPSVRSAAMDALFLRRDRYGPILDAVERGDLNPGDLSAVQIQRLCLAPDQDQAERAIGLLSPNRENNRSKLIQDYHPALTLKGDVEKGRALYRAACAVCHRAEEFGNQIGPIPATFQNRGREWMLVNILDPNREVNPEFTNYVLTREDGSVVAGLITSENANSLTVTRADGGSEAVLRSDLAELTASKLSLMPEGLEAALDHQGMADVLAYLEALK